jgi:hypothetical protein
MLPEVLCRSAAHTLPQQAGQSQTQGRPLAHKQITKRYKAFWNGVALKYTGTLQYWFWRADCAQPGC